MNPTKETAKYAANIVKEWLEDIHLMDNGEQDLEKKIFIDVMSMKIQEANPVSKETIEAFIEDLEQEILKEKDGYHPLSSIRIDYGPPRELMELAEKHGIHYSHFPIKTTLFIDSDYISISKGYGSPYVYHYLLSSGKWLITTLYGEYIDKIKDHVVNGTELCWEVR